MVRLRDVSRTIVLNGAVVPATRAAVGPTVSGRVVRVLAERGDTVRAGQPLVVLDAARQRADLQRRRLDVERAETRLALFDLSGDVATADFALERRLRDIEVRQARGMLHEAVAALADATIRAPIGGTLVQQALRIGDFAMAGAPGPGGAPIVIAAGAQPMVETEAEEIDAAEIRRGMRARVLSPVTREPLRDGAIRADPALRPARGPGAPPVFDLVVAVEDGATPIGFGTSVAVEIIVDQRVQVPTVAIPVVVRHDGRDYVFRRVGSVCVPTLITPGLADATHVEVPNLQAGDRLCAGDREALIQQAWPR